MHHHPSFFILIAAREVLLMIFAIFVTAEYFLNMVDKYGVSRANKDHVQQRARSQRDPVYCSVYAEICQPTTNQSGDLQKMWTTWNIKLKDNETNQTLDRITST